MSRSSYSDDFGEDFPNQLELYRANVARSMRGRAGQARLRELRDALLALPVKELHESVFARGTAEHPQVCALGAWALRRAGGDPVSAAALVPSDADDGDTAHELAPLGWPDLVVRDIIYENDLGGYRNALETPAERYTRVLAWVESQIVEDR